MENKMNPFSFNRLSDGSIYRGNKKGKIRVSGLVDLILNVPGFTEKMKIYAGDWKTELQKLPKSIKEALEIVSCKKDEENKEKPKEEEIEKKLQGYFDNYSAKDSYEKFFTFLPQLSQDAIDILLKVVERHFCSSGGGYRPNILIKGLLDYTERSGHAKQLLKIITKAFNENAGYIAGQLNDSTLRSNHIACDEACLEACKRIELVYFIQSNPIFRSMSDY